LYCDQTRLMYHIYMCLEGNGDLAFVCEYMLV